MEIIQGNGIPKSNGHYSMAIRHNGCIYIAGQLPIQGEDKQIPEGIEAQTLLVLQKVERIVIAAGSSKNKIIQLRVYITDVDLWGKVNAAFANFFGDHKPVRAIVPVPNLHYGCLIEIEGIAAE